LGAAEYNLEVTKNVLQKRIINTLKMNLSSLIKHSLTNQIIQFNLNRDKITHVMKIRRAVLGSHTESPWE